jgi:hypothetical protein
MCVAQVHLNATYWLAVAVVLGKSEYPGNPVTRISHVAVYQMGKDRRCRQGAVIPVDSILGICAPVQGDAGSFLLAAHRNEIDIPDSRGNCTTEKSK